MSDDPVIGWVARSDNRPITARTYHSQKGCGHLTPEQTPRPDDNLPDSLGWVPTIRHIEVTRSLAELIGLNECSYCKRDRLRASVEQEAHEYLLDRKFYVPQEVLSSLFDHLIERKYVEVNR